MKWVDINKGHTEREEYRSRLVAMEMPLKDKREDLFAAMPPLDAKKILFVFAVR